jgi:hypothetical protein
MSVSEFARHRGTTDRAVRAAIIARRIQREADGSINSEQADLDWDRNSREPRRDPTVDVEAGYKRRATWAKKNSARAQAVAAAQPQPQAAAPESPVDYGKLEDNSMSYADARAYEQNINAKLKQIELAQRQGSVLPRDRVAQSIETLFRVHRDAVLNIPNRVAALMFEQTSVADVHAVLDHELRQSLEELADGLAKLAEETAKAA